MIPSPTNSLFAIAAPPAIVKAPPSIALTASLVLAIPRPPAIVSAPVIELVLEPEPVIVHVSALMTFVKMVSPTYNRFAIAAPPAVVIVPPFVLLTASVVFDIPRPPANSTTPVLELVLAVVSVIIALGIMRLFNKSKFSVTIVPPTWRSFTTAIPPAIVNAPPDVADVAFVVLDNASPPFNTRAPELTPVLGVILFNVFINDVKLFCPDITFTFYYIKKYLIKD
jgi:hypothetical protein